MISLIDLFSGLWIKYYDIAKAYIVYGRVILDYLHVFFTAIFHLFLYIATVLTIIYIILTIGAFFSEKKEKKEKPLDLRKAPFVTIQIPTRNEDIALRCAELCLDFDYPEDKYEILIGDDSNDPLVSEKINEFVKNNEQVKVIRRKSNIGFKPGNLNNMLKHSKGSIIVVFDSDFAPGGDFLKRIVTPFTHDKDVSAVQARWNFNNFNQNLVTVLGGTIQYVCHHIALTFLSVFGLCFLCGSAEAVRKKDLLALGKWTSGSLTEDIEYSLRLHKKKKKILYLPNLECYSELPYTTKDLCKQQMRWAYGVITSYRVHAKDLVFSKTLSLKRKILSFYGGFGYVLPVLIMMLFMFGTLSFVTHRPAPIDWPKLLSELGRNIWLTSGLIIGSTFSLYRAKKTKYILKMLVSAFSVGLVITYYVNKGIFKSILGKPMQWYLLSKTTSYTNNQFL